MNNSERIFSDLLYGIDVGPLIHSSSVIRVSSSKGPLVKILAKIEVSINT